MSFSNFLLLHYQQVNVLFTTTLKSLILDSVRIEDNHYFGEWISNFKSLQGLSLTGISGIKSMSINSSTINQLQIQNCNDLMNINISAKKLRLLSLIWFSAGGTLNINAPNLDKFIWRGHVVDYNCKGDFSPLFHAEIDLSVSDQHQYEPSPMCILNKVLHSMRMAKSLVLTTHFVQGKITLLSFYNNLYSTKGLI